MHDADFICLQSKSLTASISPSRIVSVGTVLLFGLRNSCTKMSVARCPASQNAVASWEFPQPERF